MGSINMKAVLRQTGLTADRLRVWERRYGAVRPARSESGRRIYRESEVQRLKLLALLVERGASIGMIAGLTDEELLKQVGKTQPSPENSLQLRHLQSALSDLIECLDRFDLETIRSRLAQLRYSVSSRQFAMELIPHVMKLVGKRIQDGSFSIAQEHALSEIFHGHMKRIYEDLASLDGMRAEEGTFVFCTREGDTHDFGLMLAAIASRACGLRTHYVGRNLPVDALIQVALKFKPRAIVLGMSIIPKREEKVAPQAFLNAIHKRLPPDIELWIGGPAAPQLKRPQSGRSVFVFESIQALEEKLQILTGSMRC